MINSLIYPDRAQTPCKVVNYLGVWTLSGELKGLITIWKKIIKYTKGDQYGFLREKNCDLAINELKKSKMDGIAIALDIYRAYEFTNWELMEKFIEKKIIKYQ